MRITTFTFLQYQFLAILRFTSVVTSSSSMATTRGTRVGVRTSARTPVVEEIIPNSGWTEDSAGHYLLVDLPEFRKEEVKLQVDSYGRILVTGERQADVQKRLHFRLTFPVPLDSDVDNIAGKFDSGILYVTVSKKTAQESKGSGTEKAGNGENETAEEENANHAHKVNERNGEVEGAEEIDSHAHNANDGTRDPSQHDNNTAQEAKRNENEHIGDFLEQVIRKWEQESTLWSAMEVMRKNKGIVITAVIAFSLGLFVSCKFSTAS